MNTLTHAGSRMFPGKVDHQDRFLAVWRLVSSDRCSSRYLLLVCRLTAPYLTPVVFSVSVLRSLIAHTILAVSTQESRYTLNAALLLIEPKKISMKRSGVVLPA
ncbi:hypothetical protein BDD14_4730 [Edaphobacter modestus]|uniref:Uncharacterized protein n=1 Tax=Edaphobacter modestus TaxID=388466 RepID=A0A4Q7Z0Q8_9BACT|nr:hypothetical protein BDD14_4730 [Edaphobacter modestus]